MSFNELREQFQNLSDSDDDSDDDDNDAILDEDERDKSINNGSYTLTMSAANNAKPPRPCTEYMIFSQLERAYILQVLLRNQPSISNRAAIFHPSQANYAALPPLPHRYASLILPYDWHLPGKKTRRKKRKHCKSHGAIGFHDLSNRISNAWKFVDEDVKNFCAQVCSVGMADYKAAMEDWKWKRNNDYGPMVMAKTTRLPKSLIQDSKEINNTRSDVKNPRQVLTSEDSPKVSFQQVHVQDMPHGKSAARGVAPVDISNEEILSMWFAQKESNNDVPFAIYGSQGQDNNSPIDSNDKWNIGDINTDTNHQYCYECMPVTCTVSKVTYQPNTAEKPDLQLHHHSI